MTIIVIVGLMMAIISGPAALAAAPAGRAASTGCVCTEQKWCSPVTVPPPTHEIYAFALAGGGVPMIVVSPGRLVLTPQTTSVHSY